MRFIPVGLFFEKKMVDKKNIDWERIEVDYRVGLLSVREIAASNGISHTAIQKRAKIEGWERDLGKRIQAKAEALVAKREVANQIAKTRVATDSVIVEANAQVIVRIRLEHRTDISRTRALAMNMLSELECETDDIELFKQLGEIMRCPDDRGNDKRNDIYQKVISNACRIDSLKKLSETIKNLIGLEREAYGIIESQPDQKITVSVSGGLPDMPRNDE